MCVCGGFCVSGIYIQSHGLTKPVILRANIHFGIVAIKMERLD
jgi:hypothetical protein